MNQGAEQRAVVLLSGGLDSATVLAQARADGRQCYALSIDYGQRHRAELAAAARLAVCLGAVEHRVVHVDVGQFGGSSLTDADLEIPTSPSDGIPSTYVPARNTVMLSLGLGWCEVLDAHELYIGVNAVDYSGYPDCRPEFIAAFEHLARLATRAGIEGREFHVRTPLQHLAKADIIKLGVSLGLDYAQTVSCYQSDNDGRACGACDACRLRHEGFRAAGIDDPTRYRPLL
jgi:7-cyano-7-deazaguanine synthase